MKKMVLACAVSALALGGGACAADADGAADRLLWVKAMERIAEPVVAHLASNDLVGTLRGRRGAWTNPHRNLEAVGRTFDGILPFMNLPDDDTYEGRLRARWRPLVLKGIENAVTPGSHDLLEWKVKGGQPLVDAAFFAQGLHRSPRIWNALSPSVQTNLVERMRETRRIRPYASNWELFAGMVEALMLEHGFEYDEGRLLLGIDHFCPDKGDGWYAGDGMYGDGEKYSLDYYNSYVIQPMMADILDILVASGKYPQYRERIGRVQQRFRRYADIQERLISPEGAYPLVGRSICYRFGAFHHLATSYARGGAWQGHARPGAVRAALTAVIRRQSGDENFTPDGWLKVGWNGDQVSLAEGYISPGSVYLCLFVFQPLALPPSAPFWSEPASDWTQKSAWSGRPAPIDHAL